jgi:hypothetical protein
MERYDDALADFNRAIELRPSRAYYVARKADIHRLMGDREDALSRPTGPQQPQMAKWATPLISAAARSGR